MGEEKEKYWLDRIGKELASIYDDREANAIAKLLIDDVICSENTVKFPEELPEEKADQLERRLEKLKKHEPVQYVLGYTWFYEMKLRVRQGVLIPRQETEELVHWIISDWRGRESNFSILDVGTGSGCIAVALAKNFPAAKVTAVDNYNTALVVAAENAVYQDVVVDVIKNDVSDEKQWNLLPEVDIIVSNPPYVDLQEKEKMSDNVLKFEPEEALFAPSEDPQYFYKLIAQIAKARLKAGGKLYLEVNQYRAEDTIAVLKEAGFTDIELRTDLSGNHRMVRAGFGED